MSRDPQARPSVLSMWPVLPNNNLSKSYGFFFPLKAKFLVTHNHMKTSDLLFADAFVVSAKNMYFKNLIIFFFRRCLTSWACWILYAIVKVPELHSFNTTWDCKPRGEQNRCVREDEINKIFCTVMVVMYFSTHPWITRLENMPSL